LRRFLFVRGKLMLRRFNINEPAVRLRVAGSSLASFVNDIFGQSKGRYKSVAMTDFLGYWREVNGAVDVLPDESFNPLDYEQEDGTVDLQRFLASPPVQVVECKYTMPKLGTIHERIMVCSLSPEQSCLSISLKRREALLRGRLPAADNPDIRDPVAGARAEPGAEPVREAGLEGAAGRARDVRGAAGEGDGRVRGLQGGGRKPAGGLVYYSD
jgi:hypothetical protein